MRRKLMFHYAISFVVACVVIVLINIAFMWHNIYNAGGLYNYEPKEVHDFANYIQINNQEEVGLSEEGIRLLEEKNIGIQLLNKANEEVYQYNKPNHAPKVYSNTDLIEVYKSKEATMLLQEVEVNDTKLSLLMFFDSKVIKRTTFIYDANRVGKAHPFPTLIVMNSIVLILISFLFTVRLTRPVHRIINKILALSSGVYDKTTLRKGIYYKVEERLNVLGEQLASNQEERAQLEKMREEWISNISHDIKTPLTSIIGNAEIMADTDYEVTENIRTKCCNTILRKSDYIKSLVDDLNLSTRLKNNTLVLHKKKVNLVSLARHVVIDFMNDERYQENALQFECSQEELYVMVDEPLIKRVFINLITNAFVHNNHEVQVKVRVQQVSDGASIHIADNGKGVNEEELKSIFERYYRGTHTGKQIEGSGLGMAIAHDIIKVHGGTISAVSGQGEGLNIEIILKNE